MPLYKTSGTLTGYIEQDNVARAQAYLRPEWDMAKIIDDHAELSGALEHITWDLDHDGHHWSVTAFTTRPLADDELKRLSDAVSGQNSDGLGEGFEQQDWAWESGDDCGECDACRNAWGDSCYDAEQDGRMISFDWETNPCTFERVK